MTFVRSTMLSLAMLLLPVGPAWADDVSDAIDVFKRAGESGTFFGGCYAYAVFPTIGKGGFGIGAAHGSGRVYLADPGGARHVGDTSMTQVTIGLQLGGEAFSQIIFFEDKRAFDEFTSGNFEFGAQATAIAITASASAAASTTGSTATASGGPHDASTAGAYHKGMAVFCVAKGGLMYEASVGGQKFTYEPR